MSNKPIAHPVDASRTLELLSDSVHVCQSMIQGWISNRIIEVDEQVAIENGLTTRVADINHLQELVTYEQNCDLKMACGLKQEDVNFEKSSSNFEKMKVKNSTKYVNHGVAAALRAYAEETAREDVLNTVFLIDTIAAWFKLMTSRCIQLSFSRINENVYTSSIDSLLKF